MRQIRILIASPSSLTRTRLAAEVERHRDLAIVAKCRDLAETFAAAEKLVPDLILISGSLRWAPEFEVMSAVCQDLDIRWLTVDNGPAGASRKENAFADMRKCGLFHINVSDSVAGLAAQIRSVCNRDRNAMGSRQAAVPDRPSGGGKLVLIGASTGGVEALITILEEYPATCPPTAIVQHTGSKFSDGLIRLLAMHCSAQVLSGAEGIPLERGMVCIASGGDAHLGLQRRKPFRTMISNAEPVSGHLPSVDAMFNSAVPLAGDVVAVLLTGMGRDGANGLLALRKAGATTIAQDEKTSVVYGMPKVAWQLGAAERRLPIREICSAIMSASAAPSGVASLSFGKVRAR